jgi:hypothetical protein
MGTVILNYGRGFQRDELLCICKDMKVRNNATLIQSLTFWTLSIATIFLKTTFQRIDSASGLR